MNIPASTDDGRPPANGRRVCVARAMNGSDGRSKAQAHRRSGHASERAPSSPTFDRVLHLLDRALGCVLRFAGELIDFAFGLELLVVRERTRGLLHPALCLVHRSTAHWSSPYRSRGRTIRRCHTQAYAQLPKSTRSTVPHSPPRAQCPARPVSAPSPGRCDSIDDSSSAAQSGIRRITMRVLPGLSVLAVIASTALASPKVHVVTQSAVAYQHFTSIQAAVDASAPGDWVMIDAGTYTEPVRITTPRLHLRGIDRNAVVLDGQHAAGNGIEVFETDKVSIENLTVRDFDRPSRDGEDGNEIWWNGGDGSGVIGMDGWKGRYLTAYDTGLNGGYGIFISNATHGSLDQAYASGFNDSGLYLGACRDCQAVMS